ncbi:hypothetical protein F383_05812 [Gossypium arboreum]|uniref:Uncharacterized protein n=1 Tax=Gossypium arboreum TaxID=29729 RepID=A0A0B0NWL5_GOSAR|nr:hypothetical protein F383_05812 [Gossypium arboreum]
MDDTMCTPCRQESYGIYVARSHTWFQELGYVNDVFIK